MHVLSSVGITGILKRYIHRSVKDVLWRVVAGRIRRGRGPDAARGPPLGQLWCNLFLRHTKNGVYLRYLLAFEVHVGRAYVTCYCVTCPINNRLFFAHYGLKFVLSDFHLTCLHDNIFTALHGMQTRSSDENSVRPSVCLSVCPTVCLSHA